MREKSSNLECIAVKAEKYFKFLLVTVDFKKWFQFFRNGNEWFNSFVNCFQCEEIINLVLVDFAEQNDPRCSVRPLFRDVNPRGQMVPEQSQYKSSYYTDILIKAIYQLNSI